MAGALTSSAFARRHSTVGDPCRSRFRCYTRRVPRWLLAIVVVLLAFGASGASALVVSEPCARTDAAGQDDGMCPPMCVTCGCCAQAAEPMVLQIPVVVERVVTTVDAPVPTLLKTPARDILHVPKPHAS